ncbi:MAG TPA: protein kinase [Polyangiaceae bacterium]|nr:protein kinase [Polyangiaceae bacterium]
MTEFREFQDGELIAGTRYRVVRLVGVGGMGSVYEVEHVELGKRFVLKALLRELARREDLVARLRNEWRALARLQHASIVNVTDAGTSGSGVPFYVMERLDGDTLAAHLKKNRRLYVLDALEIAEQVLEALGAAHDIGVIHRDVKPANIFLVTGGGVKLLDFGVAKIADASGVVTARGIAVGTPRYMSPEQARGERVDGRSDIYATGLILFEMIAGVGPYDDARDANELLLAQLAREAPPLSALVPGVAPELERILAGMLAKDCRARPAQARIAAEQLREFVARYRRLPATDAPTVSANYGARTAVGTPASSPKRELTTRPDGVAHNAAADETGSDLLRTQPIAGEYTTQITITANTGDFSTAGANTTHVSAPAFDGSTTLEMATLVPARTVPLLGFAPVQSPLERPDRTEIIGDFTPPMPLDAIATRTRVPIVDVARPNSVTPPPVVAAGRAIRSGGPGTSRSGLAAVFSAVAIVAVLVTGFAIHRARVSAVAARPAQAAAAPPQPEPAESPIPVVASGTGTEIAQPAATPPITAAATVPTAVLAAPSPPETRARPAATAPNSAIIPSAKPAQSAPSGPFLRAAVPAPVVSSQRTKPKATHVDLGLPASGL